MHIFFQLTEGISAGTEALKQANETRDIVLFLAVVVIVVIVLGLAYIVSTRARSKAEQAQQTTSQGDNEIMLELVHYNGRLTGAVESISGTMVQLSDTVKRLEKLIAGNRAEADDRFDELGQRVNRVEHKVDKLLPNYQDTQEIDKL